MRITCHHYISAEAVPFLVCILENAEPVNFLVKLLLGGIVQFIVQLHKLCNCTFKDDNIQGQGTDE